MTKKLEVEITCIEDLFALGHVNIHNIGKNHVVVDFLPTLEGIKYRGEGKTVMEAAGKMKPTQKMK